jgi:hypothetical protein
MARTEGTFTVGSWDESTYQELADPTKLTKVTAVFVLEGGITGKATWDAVMYYRPDGTAVYAGLLLFEGALDGAEGGCVMRTDGEFTEGEARTRWEVIAGSGTGALAGLTGLASTVASQTPPGTISFDYELG